MFAELTAGAIGIYATSRIFKLHCDARRALVAVIAIIIASFLVPGGILGLVISAVVTIATFKYVYEIDWAKAIVAAAAWYAITLIVGIVLRALLGALAVLVYVGLAAAVIIGVIWAAKKIS